MVLVFHSLPPFIQSSTFPLALHRRQLVVVLPWQDVAGLPGGARGVLRGSAGDPLALNNVFIAPEAP